MILVVALHAPRVMRGAFSFPRPLLVERRGCAPSDNFRLSKVKRWISAGAARRANHALMVRDSIRGKIPQG